MHVGMGRHEPELDEAELEGAVLEDVEEVGVVAGALAAGVGEAGAGDVGGEDDVDILLAGDGQEGAVGPDGFVIVGIGGKAVEAAGLEGLGDIGFVDDAACAAGDEASAGFHLVEEVGVYHACGLGEEGHGYADEVALGEEVIEGGVGSADGLLGFGRVTLDIII